MPLDHWMLPSMTYQLVVTEQYQTNESDQRQGGKMDSTHTPARSARPFGTISRMGLIVAASALAVGLVSGVAVASPRQTTGRASATAAATTRVAASRGTDALAAQPAAERVPEFGPSYCVRGGCDLFDGPDYLLFFTTPGYTPVTMLCWTNSGWYDGTNRWFKISSIYDSDVYTSANEVLNQTKVGHC